jgi:DNA repair exonuclease SbcCD nuclease subunit
MKMAIINDSHFGARNDSDVFLEYQEDFFKNTFFPYIDKHKIDTILDLGDTFDKRKDINFKTLTSCRRFFFDEVAKRNIKLHIIVGNHTTYYKNTNELTILNTISDLYKNVTVYTEPTEVVFGKTTFLLLPWINSSNYEQFLAAVDSTSAPCCLAHLELGGFAYQAGNIQSHGMSSLLFDNFQMVLSGHYQSKSDNGRVFYLGTQYDLTWADYGEKKYFHVIDSDSLELTPVENKNKMFIRLEYDDSIKGLEKDIEADDFARLNNKIVKLVIKTKSNSILFDRLIEKITLVSPRDISIVDNQQDFMYHNNENILVNDTMTIVKQTIEEIPTDLDKSVLYSLINELHEEALME